MKIFKWMCGATKMDRTKKEKIRERNLQVTEIFKKAKKTAVVVQVHQAKGQKLCKKESDGRGTGWNEKQREAKKKMD